MPQSGNTALQLRQAAAEEFNERGFHSTDSNKIARRAGFAPQTFYRWYTDKIAVFIAVYEEWALQEHSTLASLVDKGASLEAMVNAILQQHRDYRVFRQSLRQLAVENASVRQARMESRKRQVDAILKWQHLPSSQRHVVMIRLLQVERLADGLVEREFKDLGVPAKAVKTQIANLLRVNPPT